MACEGARNSLPPPCTSPCSSWPAPPGPCPAVSTCLSDPDHLPWLGGWGAQTGGFRVPLCGEGPSAASDGAACSGSQRKSEATPGTAVYTPAGDPGALGGDSPWWRRLRAPAVVPSELPRYLPQEGTWCPGSEGSPAQGQEGRWPPDPLRGQSRNQAPSMLGPGTWQI